jgi:hypothetical protein
VSTQWPFLISLAPGQHFLHEQCQRWGQVHLQALQRAGFQHWQRAAARQRQMKRWGDLGWGAGHAHPGNAGREPGAQKDLGGEAPRLEAWDPGNRGHEGRPHLETKAYDC